MLRQAVQDVWDGLTVLLPSTDAVCRELRTLPLQFWMYWDIWMRFRYALAYDIDGEITTDFPTTVKLEKAKPVIEKLPGWKCDIRGIKNYEDLPENCRKYIEFVEEHIGFPITMISNGPGRDDIIYRNK